ncbi:Glycerol-3-phosphate acyltransferase 1 [Acorus calamus]|uniref:Glycerol-3-phosphate acyltransferase 1 n=1 Tax=Acorus calamus TaxID=4465 RepID=A0AAV9DNA5_ACOCL|nr:Glycerol-3-phosphate acyltransferase 1 [Acorus calamus]
MILMRLAHLILSCYRAAWKIRNHGKISPARPSPPTQQPFMHPTITQWPTEGRATKTLVCDINGTLLRTPSFFPYFMLVAFEGGGLLRALLLLLSYPLLCVLDQEQKLRVMCFITFCGLSSKHMETVGRAVLPKFYLENLNLHAYEALASAGKRVVITSMPRVLVEWFLKDHLSVEEVIGTELHMVGCYFTGLLTPSGVLVKHKSLKETFGDTKPDVGLGSPHDPCFISLCKEAYVVGKESMMPRGKYPKPLIFHDGRLAFLPTPTSILALFLWLPLGFSLAIFRLLVGILLPYNIVILLSALSGVKIRLKIPKTTTTTTNQKNGVLYVCTHRTLLDPILLSTTLAKPLTAVTYSLSKMSEIIAPIKTVRLNRQRDRDGETMRKLLREASGLKCLDPILFLMNPWPWYRVEVMEKVAKEFMCGGGRRRSCNVANYVQELLGTALGFECTGFTRKDKYLMLAGNEGVVKDKS